MDISQDFKIVGTLMRDVAQFEEGKMITVQIPPSDTVADMTEFGLGHVRVQQPGSTLSVTKLSS